MTYKYQIVSGNVVWGEPFKSKSQAVSWLRFARCQHPMAEIERFREHNDGSRQYWRWRMGQWMFRDIIPEPSPKDLEKWGAPQSFAIKPGESATVGNHIITNESTSTLYAQEAQE